MRQLITIVIAIACLLGVGGVAGYRESDWDNEGKDGNCKGAGWRWRLRIRYNENEGKKNISR